MINNPKIIPYEIQKLEQLPIITTNQNHEYDDYETENFDSTNDYLYHGIRNQKYLEKIENIFKEKKILAGKYLKNYYFYSDNCNKGEYVSLLNRQKTYKQYFDIFIESNISLLITPFCNAIETKYIDFYTWDKIKNLNLLQIYSYMPGEYMCKDYIPIEYIKAIGIPYIKFVREKGIEYTNKLLIDIKFLMQQYNINIPIIDTSRYNHILVSQEKEIENQSPIKKYSQLI